MTIMIPKDCVDTCPISQALYNNLSNQLACSDRVVQYLTPNVKLLGSLFWLQHNQQSVFLYLCNSIESDINLDKVTSSHAHNEDANNSTHKEELKSLLRNEEITQLLALQKKLLPETLHLHRNKIAPFIIIHPYSNDTNSFAIKSLGLYFFGKELIKSNKLGSVIYKLLGLVSSELVYSHMRQIFNPEIIINQNKDVSFSNIKHHLLDEDQEAAIKADIVLQSYNYRSDNYNLTGLNGCVASGKTETLIQRAKLILQFNPSCKIIIITANSASRVTLSSRYNNIKQHQFVDILSFSEWTKQLLKPSKHLINNIELEQVIKLQLSADLEANDITESIFIRELDLIYGRKIFYENDYLSTQKFARPYALTNVQLSQIWKAFLTLKNNLSLVDWLLPSAIPQLLWDEFEISPANTFYDHILVDDAHALPPIAFDIFKKTLKPQSGQLFITQNTNQGIINPCQLWKETALDLRGQSTRLHNIYKTNLSIINASRAFYHTRIPSENNQDTLPTDDTSTDESLPKLLHFHSNKDAENRLLNEVKKLIHDGCLPQDILIISDNSSTDHIMTRIAETLDTSTTLLNDQFFSSINQNQGIGICDFMYAQGVNAAYVFIFGLQHLFKNENHLTPGSRQCQTKLVENTRLISMIMTRAKKELTLFITAEKIPNAFINPYIEIPTDKTDKNISVVSYLSKPG